MHECSSQQNLSRQRAVELYWQDLKEPIRRNYQFSNVRPKGANSFSTFYNLEKRSQHLSRTKQSDNIRPLEGYCARRAERSEKRRSGRAGTQLYRQQRLGRIVIQRCVFVNKIGSITEPGPAPLEFVGNVHRLPHSRLKILPCVANTLLKLKLIIEADKLDNNTVDIPILNPIRLTQQIFNANYCI